MRVTTMTLGAMVLGSLAIAERPAEAQVNLGAGDIAIIGWDDSPTTPADLFTFVTLVDLPAGTIIYFTDNGWQTAGNFRGVSAADGDGSENGMPKFEATSLVPAGTIISNTSTGGNFVWTLSGAILNGGSGNYGNPALSNAGDQLYAFQAPIPSNPMLNVSQHLYVIDDTGIFENATNSNQGAVPPGLTEGLDAVTFAHFGGAVEGFMAFNTSALASGTKSEWLAAIANSANWTFATDGSQPAGSIVVTAEGDDADGDGVSDGADVCPDTPEGEGVNEDGCSCSQLECDDLDPCTVDSCDGGECSFMPVVCDDSDACTTDACIGGTCVFTPVVCNDNDGCTTDACVAGACVYTPIDCDDEDPTTIDSCEDGECVHTPAGCDDQDPCTTDEIVRGDCIHTPIICTDNDACTTDACIDGECVFTPIDCDDNDPCTTDSCEGGRCINEPIVCTDSDPCTTDACVNGECVFTPVVCDDGDACTVDSCVDGECVFAGIDADDYFISEILIDGPGADQGKEFVEISGPANTALTGLYLVVIEGDGTAAGVVDIVLNLSSWSTGSNGLLLIRDAATVLNPAPDAGTNVVVFDFNPDIENGSNTYLLVKADAGNVPVAGFDIDANSDGAADEGVFANVCLLDAVGVVENDGASNFAYASDFGGEDLGPFAFNTDGLYRLIDADGLPCAWAGGVIDSTSPATGPFTWFVSEVFGWGTTGLPAGGGFGLSPGNANIVAPLVVADPESTEACPGDSVTFEVIAIGGESFQWRFDGADIDGATGPSLTVDPVTAESFGEYDVVVTGPCGTEISAAATLGESTGDSDGDGVADCDDLCPDTAFGEAVNSSGCSCSQQTCSDGDLCTTDSCVDGACVFTPVNCDDGDGCTIDSCIGGDCLHTPIDCADDDECTIDSCQAGGCVHDPIVCDDGDPCTIDACSGGFCVADPIDCDDNDACTIDSCVGGDCVHTPVVCNDDDPCTVDSCSAGVCIYMVSDTDDDGVPDCVDVCPNVPDNQEDTDGDGIGDACENCPDEDGDGVCDADDECPGFDDNADADGDGVADGCDECAKGDDTVDCDGDGIADACAIADGLVSDFNANGIPDDCECIADLNHDGTVDGADLGLLLGNWDVTEPEGNVFGDLNADGIVDGADLGLLLGFWGDCVCDDGDGDGYCNAADNCPAAVNPDQADTDNDGVGDACEE